MVCEKDTVFNNLVQEGLCDVLPCVLMTGMMGISERVLMRTPTGLHTLRCAFSICMRVLTGALRPVGCICLP